MKKPIKLKHSLLHIGCSCKDPQCGYLRVIGFEGTDPTFEICFVKKIKQKRVSYGVVLFEKEMERLRKFLIKKSPPPKKK